MSTERERIAMMERIFGRSAPGVPLGIGDDAAVIDAREGSWVWSVDASIEHVHFRREWLCFEQLGYRSTMAALSDLAAMGAEPCGVLSSLVVPDDVDDRALQELARGQCRATLEVGTVVCGGNLARGAALGIHTTVLGTVDRPLRRDGARSGDEVFVVGASGLAAAGLRHLADGTEGEPTAAMREALKAWREPRARIEEGMAAAGRAHAAIDLSDGLAADTAQLALASGVAIMLDPAAVLLGLPADVAGEVGADPLDLALYGGEDYALLLTAPPGSERDTWRRIGRCVAAEGMAPAVYLERKGTVEPIEVRGFDHFAPKT